MIDTVGKLHPVLVHFPIAFLIGAAALESWALVRRRSWSETGRVLAALGAVACLGAVGTGLVHFRAGHYQGQLLDAALIHRALGLGTLFAALGAGALSRGSEPGALRIAGYRAALFASSALVGLTGHYGGWLVFGWGRILTF